MIKNILIYNSGGGVGDSIQLFDIVSSLKKKFYQSNIYYLGAHQNHFSGLLKDFNLSLETLDLDIKYFGFRWRHLFLTKRRFSTLNINSIDLVIDLQSKLRNTLILKQIPCKFFYSSTYNFRFTSIKKNYLKSNYNNKIIIQNLEMLISEKIDYEKYNLNYINKDFFNEAKKLLPLNNYIGFSLTQGNLYRKKSWNIEKFIKLAKLVSNKGYDPVFFVQKEHTEIIERIKNEVANAIFPEEMSNFSGPAFVTALSTCLKKAISIDNGIMHMIGLSNIPMIVLFGPTNSSKFIPRKDNIKVLDSKKMYNSEDINKITVEDVIDLI